MPSLNSLENLYLLTYQQKFKIVQFTLLQAPANVHLKMEAIIRHFLWQGGKQDKKKIQSSQME